MCAFGLKWQRRPTLSALSAANEVGFVLPYVYIVICLWCLVRGRQMTCVIYFLMGLGLDATS